MTSRPGRCRLQILSTVIATSPELRWPEGARVQQIKYIIDSVYSRWRTSWLERLRYFGRTARVTEPRSRVAFERALFGLPHLFFAVARRCSRLERLNQPLR